MKKFVRYAFCLSSLFVAGVIGEITQIPLNAATSTGGETFFNCSSDSATITWQYSYDCLWSPGQNLTTGNCDIQSNYSSHYKTEKPDGFRCNLIVFNAFLSHGGCYVCLDKSMVYGEQKVAMLIIVDSYAHITPNGTELFSGEDVTIYSSVSYRGPEYPRTSPPLPPSFYWTLKSDPSQNITSQRIVIDFRNVSTYIVVTAQPPNVPEYEINLYFSAPVQNPGGCCPPNAPTYRTSWVTPPYPVLSHSNSDSIDSRQDV